MDIGHRIAKAITDSGAEAKSIAKRCGVSLQAVYSWQRGEVKNLRNNHLFALADATGFEARWIATGEGPERQGEPDQREKALLDLYRSSDSRGKTVILRVAEQESTYVIEHEDDKKKSA